MVAEAHSVQVPPVFSLDGLKPSQIPNEEVLNKGAQEILAASTSWKAGKKYQNVQTFINTDRKKSEHHWFCVVSHFRKDQTSFDKVWAKLGQNQVWHLRSHVMGPKKVARIQYISEQQSIWTALFTPSPPLSPRVYTIYQTSWLLEYSHKQRGIIVTLPIDLSAQNMQDVADIEEKGIRGRYVSVEQLQELDDGSIEWRRVSCRDPGGLIPKFWVQRQMPHMMAEENIAFMNWFSNVVDDNPRNDDDDIQSDGFSFFPGT